MTRPGSAAPTVYPARPNPAPPSPLARIAGALVPPVLHGLLLIGLYAWTPRAASRVPPVPDAERRGGSGGSASASRRSGPSWRSGALVTLSIAATGLCVSIPIGIGLGVLMFRLSVMERAVFPYLVALQSIPILAIIPLIQSALGFGFLPKVLIVAMFTFFSIPTTLLLGLKSLDRGVIDLFRLQNASWPVMLRKAGFPSAAPTLFAGLRISAGLAVIGAIVSELFFLSGPGGLGQMLINAKIDFKYEEMYAALIVSSALSIGVYLFFNLLGNMLFAKWHGRV